MKGARQPAASSRPWRCPAASAAAAASSAAIVVPSASRNGAFSVAWKPYRRGSPVTSARRAASPGGSPAGGPTSAPASGSHPSHSAPKRANGPGAGAK